jgi:HEPN domain-containing protein
MRPITGEWVGKAEADLITAERELRAEQTPNYDAAAFHAQQCAEKYLKARLIEGEISFPKTHDLGALLRLVLPLEPAWASLRDELSALTDLAVEVRYPGASADVKDATQAVATARKVRELARASLGIAP